MLFWAIVVFLMGILGLVHEVFLVNYGIPLFAEATSVILLLISLGMLGTMLREKKKK